MIKEQIKKILDANLDKKKYAYFLFGSQVNWNAKTNSDYDIWIWTKWKLNFELFLKLKDLIQENVDYPVDVVDFTRVGEDFKALAYKNLEIWNMTEDFRIHLENFKKPILDWKKLAKKKKINMFKTV